jgi:hypothetical protein
VDDHLAPSDSGQRAFPFRARSCMATTIGWASRSGSHGLRFLCWGGRTAAGIQASPPTASEPAERERERDGGSQRKWHGLTSNHPACLRLLFRLPPPHTLLRVKGWRRTSPWMVGFMHSRGVPKPLPFAATVSFLCRGGRTEVGRPTSPAAASTRRSLNRAIALRLQWRALMGIVLLCSACSSNRSRRKGVGRSC